MNISLLGRQVDKGNGSPPLLKEGIQVGEAVQGHHPNSTKQARTTNGKPMQFVALSRLQGCPEYFGNALRKVLCGIGTIDVKRTTSTVFDIGQWLFMARASHKGPNCAAKTLCEQIHNNAVFSGWLLAALTAFQRSATLSPNTASAPAILKHKAAKDPHSTHA